MAVKDGDTIEVLKEGKAVTIRLAEIDCPEKAQPFGNKAKKFTSELCFGRTVKVLPQDIDRYGRTVAKVILPSGRSLNQELVKAGLAWQYTKYSHDEYLKHLEKEARENGRGLWRDPHPIAPWEWKHGGKREIQAPNSSIESEEINSSKGKNGPQNAQIIFHGNIKQIPLSFMCVGTENQTRKSRYIQNSKGSNRKERRALQGVQAPDGRLIRFIS